jgi:glutamate racemase
LLLGPIAAATPAGVELVTQGEVVAERLVDWLSRHPEMAARLTGGGRRQYLTTDDPDWFADRGRTILGDRISVRRVHL